MPSLIPLLVILALLVAIYSAVKQASALWIAVVLLAVAELLQVWK